MNEKGAFARVRELERRPDSLEERVREAYRLLADGEALAQEFGREQTEIR